MPDSGRVIPGDRRVFLRVTWDRFVDLWKPQAGWTLLVWAALTAVVTPLASASLGRLLVGPNRVIGNDALIAFVLSPRGLTYVVLAGAVAATAAVVRYAGLFIMTVDDLEGRRPTVQSTLQALAPLVPALFRLSAAAVAASLLVAMPLTLALGGVYLALLRAHDINYYLDARPPEWRLALLLAAIFAVLWLAGVAYLVVRLLPTVPAYLDGHRPLRAAVRRAWIHTEGRARRLLQAAPLVIGGWLALRSAVHAVYFLMGSSIIESVADGSPSPTRIVIAVAIYATGAAALDGVMSFVGFSFTSMLLTRVYYTVSRAREAIDPSLAAPVSRPPRSPHWLRPGARSRTPARVVLALVVLAAAGATAGGVLLEFVPDARRVVITAHRAGATAAPENTLLALDRAMTAGADVVEIDVQRTRDGVIVVAHDADLMRTARDPRRIAQSTYNELRQVVIGPDSDLDVDRRRLATLDEFLAASRSRVTLLIELKYYGWDPDLAPETIARVRALGMEREVWMMSLNLDAVHQIRQLAPSIVTGYLASVTVGSPARLPVTFLGVPPRIATPAFTRDAHARDVQVHVWTLNQADAMMEAAGRGADGIITDDVALGARFRDELAALPAAAHALLRFHSLFLDEEETSLLVEEQ
jgi:glycerophosphoryl diester phosphodiesterase